MFNQIFFEMRIYEKQDWISDKYSAYFDHSQCQPGDRANMVAATTLRLPSEFGLWVQLNQLRFNEQSPHDFLPEGGSTPSQAWVLTDPNGLGGTSTWAQLQPTGSAG